MPTLFLVIPHFPIGKQYSYITGESNDKKLKYLVMEKFEKSLEDYCKESGGKLCLNDMFSVYGPDSFLSIMASVIQGSSDTTLYIITLYFGTIGIKKIKYALWAGLLADLVTVILSLLIVPLFF